MPTTDAVTPSPVLTGRQVQLVRLLASGRTARQAAADLGIAAGTANLHLFCARRRAAARTNAELVTIAALAGLV